jgi:small subunit ribosomal protein S5
MVQHKEKKTVAAPETDAGGSEKKEFVETVISVRRVTKVTKGGKRFSFSAFVVSGNQTGSVGIGSGKGREASMAVAKATAAARKRLIPVAIRGTTLPFEVQGKHGVSLVILRPAHPGTGIKASRAVSAVMRALGVTDVLTKSIKASRSGQNLVKATLNALAKCRTAADIARLRGISIKKVVKGAHYVEAQ